MENLCVLFIFLLKLCVGLESTWHGYHPDLNFHNREELEVANVTVDDEFRIDEKVSEWKGIRVDKINFLAGLKKSEIVIAPIKLNANKTKFTQKPYNIKMSEEPMDVAFYQQWNRREKKSEVFLAVATLKPQITWFKIGETNHRKIWVWSLEKKPTHINIFEIDYKPHLLVITEYLSEASADLYQFDLNTPNFWLKQTLPLNNPARTSILTSLGPDYFLAIPQKSLDLLLIYKLGNNHFSSYKNLTSVGISEVVAFKMGHKQFFAFNGLQAGIFHVLHNDIVEEKVIGSNLDGVNFWLPIPVSTYRDETILIAQRSLLHGPHKSFVIELITYNGRNFEEHEDVQCLYFGETVLGLSCLLPEENVNGIRGSITVSLNNIIGLIVPRFNFSELFMVQIHINKTPNPVIKQFEELVSRREYLDKLMKVQEKRYEEIIQSYESTNLQPSQMQLEEMNQELSDLEKEIAAFKFSTITFNSEVEIKDGIFNNLKISLLDKQNPEKVLTDIVMSNDLKRIPSRKTFTNLVVTDFTFEKIGKIQSEDILFKTDNITIEGDLVLGKPFRISEDLETKQVNGQPFDIIELNVPINGLVFDEVEVLGNFGIDQFNNIPMAAMKNQPVEISGNLRVEKVNGENFDEFLSQLCLKNLKNYIPGTTKILGDVAARQVQTSSVNDLKFPQEYVFRSGTLGNITGAKNFTKTLTTSRLNCEGTIDKIHPWQIITLSTDQNITSTANFKNIKVMESLFIGGKVFGEEVSKFLPNPTILETDILKSNVNFKDLIVEGSIFLSENLNGQNFKAILADIVYKNEEEAMIEGLTKMPEGLTIREDLQIKSNSINDIHLDSIITKDKEQILNLTTINGIVNFGNVEVEGLYNLFNITQLDDEIVKMEGEQFITSTLIFEDGIEVNHLEIINTINGLTEEEILINKQEEVLNFYSLSSDNVIVEGNIIGNIKNFDLNEFNQRRLSFSEDQTIDSSYIVKNSTIAFLEPLQINERKVNSFDSDFIDEYIKEELKQGKFAISQLHVDGSLDIAQIDGDEPVGLGGSLWNTDVNKYNLTNLTFYDDVYFDSVTIHQLSGVDFWKFLSNIVFKNESNIKISGHKTFLKGLTVDKLIEIKHLNNISLKNILTKHGLQKISSPFTIHGDVDFGNNVTITDTINAFSVQLITDNYEFSDNKFKIKGDVLFNRLPYIDHLEILGYANDKLAQKTLKSLIYKDQDFKLDGHTIFENQVEIGGNIRVLDKTNKIDFPALVSKMAMITKDTDIKTEAKFSKEVTIEDEITIHRDIQTADFNEINLRSWVDKAIFIDQGFLEGNFIFEEAEIGDNLKTDFLNGIDFNTLIPLRTEQKIPGLSFDEINCFQDLQVGKSTNFLDLPAEFDNTVTIDSDQEITSEIEFSPTSFIEGNLTLEGFINGRNVSKIVTTNTDQTLNGIYKFNSKAILEGNFNIDGLVNGINVSNWEEQGLKIDSGNYQNISHNWKIRHTLILENNTEGDGLINGLDLRKFRHDIDEKRSYKYAMESRFIDDYTNICKDLTYIYKKLKRQIYKFDYFKNFQDLSFYNKIRHVHNFQHENNFYLLISEEANCESLLFIYNINFRFVKKINLGIVDQIISVSNENFSYLVVRNEANQSCEIEGTNIWKITDEDFEHFLTMENQDLLQESQVPATFYGLKGNVVMEFNILMQSPFLQIYRKWEVNENNVSFVPRGLGTGLALRNGKKLIRLNRNDPIIEDFNPDIETIIRGNFTEESNIYLPSSRNDDLIVMKVGIKSNQRSLLAVADREETSVQGSFDFIKIYEDAIKGKIFHKVPAYKPSSLISLEFSNGETFLAFLEDKSVFQIYEYKGIEGFKLRLTTKLQGSSLFVTNPNGHKIVGVINKNEIILIKAAMLGNQIDRNLYCGL